MAGDEVTLLCPADPDEDVQLRRTNSGADCVRIMEDEIREGEPSADAEPTRRSDCVDVLAHSDAGEATEAADVEPAPPALAAATAAAAPPPPPAPSSWASRRLAKSTADERRAFAVSKLGGLRSTTIGDSTRERDLDIPVSTATDGGVEMHVRCKRRNDDGTGGSQEKTDFVEDPALVTGAKVEAKRGPNVACSGTMVMASWLLHEDSLSVALTKSIKATQVWLAGAASVKMPASSTVCSAVGMSPIVGDFLGNSASGDESPCVGVVPIWNNGPESSTSSPPTVGVQGDKDVFAVSLVAETFCKARMARWTS